MTKPSTINWRRRDEHVCPFTPGEEMFVVTECGERLFDVIRVEDLEGDVIWCNGEDPWQRDWPDVVRWVPIEEIDATLLEPTETTHDA